MKLRAGLAAAADQAWLSLLNLSISFVFIKYADKDEYGAYLLLMTPLFLIQGIQNALLSSPISTLLPKTDSTQKNTVYETAVLSLAINSIVFAILGGSGLAVFELIHSTGLSISHCIVFSLAVAGALAREGSRLLYYADRNPLRALTGDLVYGAILISVMGLALHTTKLDAMIGLAAIAVAGLAPFLLKIGVLPRLKLSFSVVKDFWSCGRWALVGVLVTWVNLNAYPLVVATKLSVEEVADINAARLFLMPFSVLITGWSNLMRPVISAHSSRNEFLPIRKISIFAISCGLVFLTCFSVFVYAFYSEVELLLGAQYDGLKGLVLLWGCFFAFNLIRTVLMASLMTTSDGYKRLQAISTFVLPVSIFGLLFFAELGSGAVVSVLICVELIQMVFIARLVVFFEWKKTR